MSASKTGLLCLVALGLARRAAADALITAFAQAADNAMQAAMVVGVVLAATLILGGLWLIKRRRGKLRTAQGSDADENE